MNFKIRAFILMILFASLVGALWSSLFRDAEGFLESSVCLLVSVAVALALFVITWSSVWRRAFGWFALVIIGQGLALQFINAGPTVHYQHYRSILDIYSVQDMLILVFLAIQTMVVVFAIRSHLNKVLVWLHTYFGVTRTLLVLAALVIFGVFPSREVEVFVLEMVLSGLVILTQFGCLFLGISSVPQDKLSILGQRTVNFLDGADDNKKLFGVSIDRLAIGCAIWAIIIATLLVIFSYDRHPHIPDEVAYLFHANYFSQGLLSVPAPPVPEAVESYLMDCNKERCISPVPPGWPAMLAVGAYAGVPWLVNPLLSGLNVILLFLLIRLLYDRSTARLSILLIVTSPWYLFISMSFMTHTFSLTCALIAAISVVQMRRKKSSLWGAVSGVAIGLLSLNRPLEGLVVGSVLGLAALLTPGRRFRFGPVIALGIFSILVGSLVLPYNKAMTGDPLKFPIMVYADKALGPGVNSLGFGPEKGTHWGGMDPFPGHGFPDVVVNAVLNIDAMNIELFGWSIGSLLPILLLLAARRPRSRERIVNADRWMLFFLVAIFAFQSLYWFSGGPDFGARYYYLSIIPLVVLTARGIKYLGHAIPDNTLSPDQWKGAVLLGVMVLGFSSLINFSPWRAIDKYHNYRGMQPGMRTLLSENDFGKALILINGKAHPDLNSAMVYSSIDPYGNDPVIVWNRNEEVRIKLLESYPDRKVWYVDGPSRTGAGYRIVSGPISNPASK